MCVCVREREFTYHTYTISDKQMKYSRRHWTMKKSYSIEYMCYVYNVIKHYCRHVGMDGATMAFYRGRQESKLCHATWINILTNT